MFLMNDEMSDLFPIVFISKIDSLQSIPLYNSPQPFLVPLYTPSPP